MRLWVDDLRPPPGSGWFWAKDSKTAIRALDYWRKIGLACDEISLDHDLGGDDTTRPIVLWMCQNAWPTSRVYCHSANPVGREWIEGMIARYAP